MPPHVHYCEPFAGGLSVLLAKNPEGVSEVVNDLNGALTNFWRVLADPIAFEEFRRKVEATPFSEWAWSWSEGVLIEWTSRFDWMQTSPSVVCAVAFFIRCRQSLAGRMDAFAPLSRTRTRKGMNEQASAWLSAVEGLPAVHERLKRVVVIGPKPAVEVIKQQDGEQTLYYLDPPYLHETRATTSEYAHEMTNDQHAELLRTLSQVKGRFLLSGYPNAMYDEYAKCHNWQHVDFDLANHAAGGKDKRRMVERVYCNFDLGGGPC